MKGTSMHMGTSSHKAAMKPGPPLVGSFIDGERATFDEAEKASKEGKAVTHTNKEAIKKAKKQLNNGEISQSEYDQLSTKKYAPEKNKKEFNKAKSDDAKAQASTEKRAKILKTSARATGDRNAEGYKGTKEKRAADAAFDKKNSKIKTEKSKKPLTGDDYQGVKGAEVTISNKAATFASTGGGTKNTKDFKREAKAKKMEELKKKGAPMMGETTRDKVKKARAKGKLTPKLTPRKIQRPVERIDYKKKKKA